MNDLPLLLYTTNGPGNLEKKSPGQVKMDVVSLPSSFVSRNQLSEHGSLCRRILMLAEDGYIHTCVRTALRVCVRTYLRLLSEPFWFWVINCRKFLITPSTSAASSSSSSSSSTYDSSFPLLSYLQTDRQTDGQTDRQTVD